MNIRLPCEGTTRFSLGYRPLLDTIPEKDAQFDTPLSQAEAIGQRKRAGLNKSSKNRPFNGKYYGGKAPKTLL